MIIRRRTGGTGARRPKCSTLSSSWASPPSPGRSPISAISATNSRCARSGSSKGAERVAARWAGHRKVPQVAFRPDRTKHAKAAPFKRNDQMLDVLPIGIIVFPGTGIQEKLADKARKLDIPVWKFGDV
ncbi:hypothetical protein GCM10017643_35260 [Ancylobacter dichloromethanicus]|uniref:YspA cpYpsA-related SLOG domain-containing protein n=1 Tax=Ancylobacter dichloromethanicus TaxID=518825 RepID=A0A9W6JCB5_9HYPH|nr:hypothetical protein GCM10017643_35260 [Ancylobacter dichloromethanicus]